MAEEGDYKDWSAVVFLDASLDRRQAAANLMRLNDVLANLGFDRKNVSLLRTHFEYLSHNEEFGKPDLIILPSQIYIEAVGGDSIHTRTVFIAAHCAEIPVVADENIISEDELDRIIAHDLWGENITGLSAATRGPVLFSNDLSRSEPAKINLQNCSEEELGGAINEARKNLPLANRRGNVARVRADFSWEEVERFRSLSGCGNTHFEEVPGKPERYRRVAPTGSKAARRE